ncbi:hypothetical protein GCM10009675_07720 [Prauserella alba]|uniref:Uncharacterized protein n=1 Tax=Prauserella alba TaxID=176898 RepID=A0ABP4FQ53_9PSEU
MLALANFGHPVEPEPRKGAGDGLPLRVEDLGFGHDVDDYSGHDRLLLAFESTALKNISAGRIARQA